MQKSNPKRRIRPPQRQRRPGSEAAMIPQPEAAPFAYQSSARLAGKVALITGGDSGIGRAVAVLFAREGADVVISYLSEHADAKQTLAMIEAQGRRGISIAGDIRDEGFCKRLVKATLKGFGRLDVLVNNAAEQTEQDDIRRITAQQLQRTFATNIFSQFYLVKAALPHLKPGSSIINSSSVTAYRGSAHLLDYAATKGAIVTFTRSLSAHLVDKGIRVNAVAPGPVWTPLIPSTFSAKAVAKFGSDVPMKRAGEPNEIAPSYLFLASSDSAFMTGQVLHPNGGEVVGA